jgi:hypothetical protein
MPILSFGLECGGLPPLSLPRDDAEQQQGCHAFLKNQSGAGAPHSKTRWMPVLFALMLVIAPSLLAQGKGVVEGRLINRTSPSIIGADVDLDVVGLGGGMSILKSSKTDAAGKFRIDGLPADMPMMIRANYKSVNYHGRVSFDAAGKATVEIPIYETTISMSGVRAEGVRLAFQLGGDRLHAIETISFNNESSPPKSVMNMQGDFRFSKPEGILEPPKLSVTSPGAAMPLSQSALESADGSTYYSLFPLRPGVTTFEVDEELPYRDRTYTLRKKFHYDISSIEIGAIPQDMTVSGEGLTRVKSDAQRNFSIYTGGPIKAGTEIVWTFTGGTPVAEPEQVQSGETKVKPMPTIIGRNALILGPLLLLGFIVVLWYAMQSMPESGSKQDSRVKELRARRDQLLNYLANLDHRAEDQSIDQREYRRLRELGRRQLRRIELLLKK